MKTFKSFFAFFLVSILVLSANSCKKDGSEELGPFIEAPVGRFKDAIDAQAGEARIVDYRSKADFDAGHIPGAINIPATVQNTKSNNSPFCEEILNRFPDKTKPIFLYGNKSSIDLQRIVPGRVSKIGFGRSNTYVLQGGFEAWEEAGFEVVKP